MFVITVPDVGTLTYTGDAWSDDSPDGLVKLIASHPTAPQAASVTGPMLPASWADERWAYLHTLTALAAAGLTTRVSEAPDFGDLVEVPDGAVA